MTTIVIPSYNQAEFLPSAIESALEQDCPVIVVDDGSTDGSLEIARKYPVKIVSQRNKGLASARNTGLMNITTEYVLFLDADDMLMEGAIKKLEALIGDADVIVPSFKEFGVSNNHVILIPRPTLEDFKIGNRLGYCALFKREVLLETGGYSPRMTFGYEDMHLWIDLLTREKNIITTEEVLWLYRTKENSMITTAREHHDELMAQIAKDFPHVELP